MNYENYANTLCDLISVTVLAMDNNSSQLKAPPEIYKYQVLSELGLQM